jgi:YHS domain-containing protein
MRFLILIGLIYLCFKFLKSLGSPTKAPLRNADFQGKAGEIDDVMIKDPFCGVYFPKRDGVYLKQKGADLFFCSTKCKDRFLELKE